MMETYKIRGLAVACGLIVWTIIALVGGRAEAWDSPLYFAVGLPMMVISAGAMGWFFPIRGWVHGFFVSIGQGIGLIFSGLISGGGFGLLPLGIILVLVLSLPFVAASALTSFIHMKVKR